MHAVALCLHETWNQSLAIYSSFAEVAFIFVAVSHLNLLYLCAVRKLLTVFRKVPAALAVPFFFLRNSTIIRVHTTIAHKKRDSNSNNKWRIEEKHWSIGPSSLKFLWHNILIERVSTHTHTVFARSL